MTTVLLRPRDRATITPFGWLDIALEFRVPNFSIRANWALCLRLSRSSTNSKALSWQSGENASLRIYFAGSVARVYSC